MSLARSLARVGGWLGRWPIALAVCALFAAILPARLDVAGLWEPQERQLSDRIAPPLAPGAGSAAAAPAKPVASSVTNKATGKLVEDACLRAAPAEPQARSLTNRAIRWGRDSVGDNDAGRRVPLALLGALTLLAAAGTAMRLAGARAGIVTAIIALSMPLLALQSRMLTSDIGTACGGALIIYGATALGQLRRGLPWAILDALVALIALAAGVILGFFGGGALLGLLVPVGAIAAAGSLGAPLVGAIRRREPVAPWLAALIAALAAAGLIALIAYQIYDLKPPYPGLTPPPVRELFGKAIVPNGCYSWALGGIWKPDDDLRAIYDSMFEQIAYGTYPWGLVAPIAMTALLTSADPRRKRLGAITLAWAGAAWVAAEVFQRKVGFTLYAGFPALAIAVGAWFDGMLAGRARGDASAMPAGVRLIALFCVLGALDLGKDMQSFAERLTSLLVGNDAVPYPLQATLLFLPARVWVLILGLVIALGFAAALVAWPVSRDGPSPRDLWCRRLATRAAIGSIVATIALAAFWPAIWQPRLAEHLSSKAMLETYAQLAKPGDDLVIMGDLGQAPLDYLHLQPQTSSDRSAVLSALARPNRVFAIAPQSELCTLHREMAGKPYFVIDDRNQRSLLLSNRVDGTTDKNPLRTAIVHDEPKDIRSRPKGKVVWDGRIQLLGWDIPRSVPRGSRFEVTVYYKILQPVGGTWKALMHFDGQAGRAGSGDHDPIAGRCPTSTWQPGDYIIDRFTTSAGGGAYPAGVYQVWTGFFTGANPNWRNMPLSEAPGDLRDTADRVKITTIGLE